MRPFIRHLFTVVNLKDMYYDQELWKFHWTKKIKSFFFSPNKNEELISRIVDLFREEKHFSI